MIRFLRTPLDVPLVLFVASALIGVWVSYDPGMSWNRFLLYVLAVILFYITASLRSIQSLPNVLVWLFILANTALSLYFVTQHNFSADDKLNSIERIGAYLNQLVPQLHLWQPHPNNIAGLLEMALPLNIAFAFANRRQQGWIKLLLGMTALIIGFGLLLTRSRGAWLALALVAVAAAIGWGMTRNANSKTHAANQPRRLAFPLALSAVLAYLLAWWLVSSYGVTLDSLVGSIPGNTGSISRLELYGQVIGLVRDYVFTGSGLGTFPMVYSTYALLINVFFLPHAHNLVLQTWMDQGLIGVFALLWLIATFYTWIWKHRNGLPVLALGGAASTTVMWLHGLVDAPLWYSPATTAFQFVPLGMTIAAQGNGPEENSVGRFQLSRLAIPAGIALVIAAALWGGKSIAAAWLANMGSVSQAKIELGSYHFPERLVEYARRDADLTQAESLFSGALAFDPENSTANQRLSEIALARGEYEAAQQYAQAAFTSDANDEVTKQLLGDAYLAQGNSEEAFVLWSQVRDAASKLEIEAAVRYESVGDTERARQVRILAQRIRIANETARGKGTP